MKKTININLGGLVFKIDDDAYERLNLYLEALKNKFHNVDERNEIIQDIEYRFAELFSANLNEKQEVVTLEMVTNAVNTMGAPEEIEDEELTISEDNYQTQSNSNQKIKKKLFRDPDNRVFAGVISGVSKYLGFSDAIWLRIAMVLIVIAGFGFPIFLYILMWVVTPYAKTATDKLQMTGSSVTLENIENQVKKNINTDEIKRTTAIITDKASDIAPIILKIIGIGLVLLFGFKLIALTFVLFGGGLLFSNFNTSYLNLLFDSNTSYYLGLVSLYFLLAIPLILAMYFGLKVFTKRKVNWILSLTIAFFLSTLAFIGIITSAYSITKGFTAEAEQTNFVALEDPTMDELNIEFPYEKLQDNFNINMNVNFGNASFKKSNINGFKVFPSKKEIHINAVSLNIVPNKTDSIFKLSKTVTSRGKSLEDAEEKLTHINNEFDYLMENTIAIPGKIVLTDETKWRMQLMNYKLEMPIGKRVYFGDNAKKVIQSVNFNGDYSRKELANNTWEMTKQGLKCVTCGEE